MHMYYNRLHQAFDEVYGDHMPGGPLNGEAGDGGEPFDPFDDCDRFVPTHVWHGDEGSLAILAIEVEHTSDPELLLRIAEDLVETARILCQDGPQLPPDLM